MRILGWNCRGICNTSTVRALGAQIKRHCPQVVFLCETKASESRLKKLANSLGFSNQLIVVAQGRSGGICLFWSLSIAVDVLEFNAVTVAVNIRDHMCSWALVGFYGPPYHRKRIKAWTNLHALLQSFTGPWLCFGDFNSILDANEKEGGHSGSCFTAPNFLRNLLFDLGAVLWTWGSQVPNLLGATKDGGVVVSKKGLIVVLLTRFGD